MTYEEAARSVLITVAAERLTEAQDRVSQAENKWHIEAAKAVETCTIEQCALASEAKKAYERALGFEERWEEVLKALQDRNRSRRVK